MFNKYQAVFRSRWKAVWWAAGVCLTAYCTVPAVDEVSQHYDKQRPAHANPWGLHKKD